MSKLFAFELCGGAMVVASLNEQVGDWTAYLGVSGAGNLGFMNLDLTQENVAKHGDKIQKIPAERLFPELAGLYRWRS